jgi:ParB family transcriptional regulator, chromosome partitioning protein
MAEETQRPRLGRGLAALLGDAGGESAHVSAPVSTIETPRTPKTVPVEFLVPNPFNPRKAFLEADLEELAESIRKRGIIQPIVVRVMLHNAQHYEIIAGERRWRAAQRAGLHEVPIVIMAAEDRAMLELAMIENVQRSDLNPIEEASGYDLLIKDFGYTQLELSETIGKSRSHLANMLRILDLPESIKALVANGQISAGHARALLAVQNPEKVAQDIIDQGLTVRDVERLAQQKNISAETTKQASPMQPDASLKALEHSLEEHLGMKVSISAKGEKGELRIRYENLDQFDALCNRLKSL